MCSHRSKMYPSRQMLLEESSGAVWDTIRYEPSMGGLAIVLDTQTSLTTIVDGLAARRCNGVAFVCCKPSRGSCDTICSFDRKKCSERFTCHTANVQA